MQQRYVPQGCLWIELAGTANLWQDCFWIGKEIICHLINPAVKKVFLCMFMLPRPYLHICRSHVNQGRVSGWIIFGVVLKLGMHSWVIFPLFFQLTIYHIMGFQCHIRLWSVLLLISWYYELMKINGLKRLFCGLRHLLSSPLQSQESWDRHAGGRKPAVVCSLQTSTYAII